jgi:pyrimidine-nucleoside phosphorylase
MFVVSEILAQKRDGHALSADALRFICRGYQDGGVPDYQMSALLMAFCTRGMSAEEASVLMESMLHSGTVADLSQIPGRKVDKHSTGGVGDKVSLSLAPLVAACGVRVPMVSGRALAHTGGTLDKLESCPGFTVDLPLQKYRALVADVGCALIGQTKEIAPLDKKLYALRDVTGTVESIPLIACSIMSKKMAEGIDALVLDVKLGDGAFMRDRANAEALARTMVAMGAAHGKRVVALITQMDQPLGHAVGNALEWREATEMLRGRGPADYRECVLVLAAEMLVLGHAAETLMQARFLAEAAIADGRALQKWREIIQAQGGDARYVDAPETLHPAPAISEVRAVQSGTVMHIETRAIGLLAIALGAGRATLGAAIDPAVGFEVFAKVGARVQAGEVIARVHAREKNKAEAFAAELGRLIHLADSEAEPLPLVIDRIAQ